MTSEIERDLLNAERQDPPPELRRQVLATATPLIQPHESRLDAIWFSRPWRLASVLVFVGSIAADALSSETGSLPPQVESLRISSSVEIAEQVAIDAGLEEAEVAAIVAQASLPWTDVDATSGVPVEFTGVPE